MDDSVHNREATVPCHVLQSTICGGFERQVCIALPPITAEVSGSAIGRELPVTLDQNQRQLTGNACVSSRPTNDVSKNSRLPFNSVSLRQNKGGLCCTQLLEPLNGWPQ